MKKTKTILLALFLLFPTVFLTTACSDMGSLDEPETENPEPESPNTPENPENGKVPQELLDKIHEIYDHTTTGPQTVTTVHQLAILTSICASLDTAGPISITAATLNDTPVTLVTLGGTQEREGQATTMKESQLASFGKPNDYLAAVKDLFLDGTVPTDRPVLLTGISLGGMIAQQLLGEKELKQEITAVITFGSPINVPLDRGSVKVVRFADIHDKVPEMGETVIRSGLATSGQYSRKELKQLLDRLDAEEKIERTSQYTGMIETHALSYIEDPCWNDIDFLGDPARRNVLVLKEQMTFYPAPVRNAE